tara:strand:- start:16 stop:276 length:261 start_codon:yes stop_codon:yes gene_type:complete
MKYKSSDEVVKDLMPNVINLVKEKAFINPDQASDCDALGILVARCLDWSGEDIMEVIFSALEDSNYHDLNQRLLKTYQDWEITGCQ